MAHHVVECCGAVDKQGLQQGFRNIYLLCCGILCNVLPLTEVFDRLHPIPIFEGSIALIKKVAHQLDQKALKREWMGLVGYDIKPNSKQPQQ